MFEKNKENGLNSFLRIMNYVLNYKFIFIIGVLCMIVSSLSVTISTVLIKITMDDYIVPMTTNSSAILYSGFKFMILKLLVVYLICVIAKYIYSIIMVKIEAELVQEIRNELFNRMMRLPISFFDKRAKGDIMSLYTNDIDVMRFILSETFSSIVSCSVSIIGILSVMLYYNLKLTLLVSVIFCLMIVITKLFSSISKKLFDDQQKSVGAINGFIEEIINGQPVVKVFCHEKQTTMDFDVFNEDLYNISCKANTYSNALMPIMMNLGNIGYVIVLVFGSMLAINDKISLGVILAFLRYTKAFVNPIGELSEQIPIIMKAIAGTKRFFDILDMDIEVDNGNINIEDGKIKTENNIFNFKGDIKFKNVYFGYDNDNNVLKNITFDVKCGQKIAFVGATGSGKTTITNLIMRFYDANSGTITIDDVDIKTIKKEDLRKLISVVLQDVHLFNGSIIDNIRYGKLDVSNQKVIEISKLTKTDNFIRNLKDGYETNLKSDASNLSQGERQLLAIARTMVADRPILIFDEATSSVDTLTEKLINNVLDTLFMDKTVFVIAHRLSTIRNAHKIVVLENGEVIEFGNHNELLEKKGRYYQLCSAITELD